MAKNKVDLSDVSHDDLLAELKNRLSTAGAGSEGGEDFPTPDEIDEMDTDALQELCEKVGVDFEKKDDEEMQSMLKLIHAIGAEETEDLDKDEVKALCVALGIKPTKDVDKNVEAIQTYLSNDDTKKDADETEDSEEESEDESEEESEDSEEESEEETEDSEEEEEEEEKPKKKKGKKSDDDEDESEEESEDETEEEDSEEESEDSEEESEEESEETEDIDTAAVVKKSGKYPKEEIMKKRLDAFNKVGKDKIDVKKLGAKKAYAKLLERLVDHEGNIANWGAPYIRESEGWCCGVPMKDTRLKGDKKDYGKCLVTGKLFSLDEEGSFVEKED